MTSVKKNVSGQHQGSNNARRKEKSMIQTTEMQKCLREIVSKEPWDKEELADWANEFLAVYEDEVWERRKEERLREERTKIVTAQAIVDTRRIKV